MNLARKHSRFAAYLIDSIIYGSVSVLIFAVTFFIYALIAGTSLPSIANSNNLQSAVGLTFILGYLTVSIIITILVGVYYAHFLSKNAQTPGMKFVGIKAQKEDGSNLTFQEAAIRYIVFSILGFLGAALAYIPYVGIFLYIPAMFGIYFWCLIDKKQQNVYDMIHHVVYVKDNENEKRSKIVIGSYFGCGCLAFILAIAAFFAIGVSTMSKMNNGNKTSIVPESYSQKSNRLEKECMQNNDAKNFSSLSGYCSCLSLYELDESVPNEKKEEVKAQECGFYRKSNPTSTSTTKVTSTEKMMPMMNTNLYNSNYTNCMKDADAYVAMKFPGKKATNGTSYCNCMATVAATYYTESAATEKEALVKNCSVYTK